MLKDLLYSRNEKIEVNQVDLMKRNQDVPGCARRRHKSRNDDDEDHDYEDDDADSCDAPDTETFHARPPSQVPQQMWYGRRASRQEVLEYPPMKQTQKWGRLVLGLKILVFLKGFGCSGHRQFLSELF
jgi:hypothetical protein